MNNNVSEMLGIMTTAALAARKDLTLLVASIDLIEAMGQPNELKTRWEQHGGDNMSYEGMVEQARLALDYANRTYESVTKHSPNKLGPLADKLVAETEGR
jgi:hypothetical protein